MAVYELRPEQEKLCHDVILELYNFIELADEALLDQRKVEKIRNQVTKKHLATPPRNIELIAAYNKLVEEGTIEPNDTIFSFLVKRKIRSSSGIANITVLMKAFGCPGKCIFCPTQPDMPKSYFSNQPAMLRAVRNNFDCYKQMKTRLNGLQTQGHDISKVDVRTAGGTWSSYLLDYQEFFVKSIYFALNEGPGDFLPNEEATKRITAASLEDLITENETAKCRCVGLWVETRPDWVDEAEVTRLRRFGVTGIELGIQTTNDEVNNFNRRGHGLAESIKATQLCRDAGLKICHHIMPNLPTASIQSDLQTVTDLFGKGWLEPDYIKVYPCMVTPYTTLAKMVEKDPSIFTAYTDDQLTKIVTTIIQMVPEYCRIIRILRDFPSEVVLQGTKMSNLRQIISNSGVTSRDIRSREIRGNNYIPTNVKLITRQYQANEGEEFFISFEDTIQDKLIGLVRLRLPKNKNTYIPELTDAALVRELHVYGTQKSLNKDKKDSLKSKTQHKGYGRHLMEAAEQTAAAAGYKKIAVISAIGTREYYKKLGYELEGTYMVKGI
ncbi:hypothetical protein CO045_02305 [Candidatus Peregrinibacteria bacterium CG_4_9_14_0_2_um_filter_41_14]|nr:MAG: hypothetical protein COY06_05545 [Candidatus Peregrinibacteria bacterium CG_4_10_14_0_2_um_filter_41_8]PJC38048.1 MAG: hypothetical protein CO045_02305 [Candidatus Peregrinibacteria bacterium CG_4_9_14_0_2_um_filter_41_14]